MIAMDVLAVKKAKKARLDQRLWKTLGFKIWLSKSKAKF